MMRSRPAAVRIGSWAASRRRTLTSGIAGWLGRQDPRSTVPHIFAAGDVNGISMLVPSARHEGRIAAENAVLGTRRKITHDTVPTGSFTDPEYGSVGLTETQARERYDCEVAVMRYDDLLRPIADGRPEGFCKLIVERHRRYILGAHVIGEYSAEVIQMAAACISANMRIEQSQTCN
jgi:pyruvate/2-oxoglutarate dehydrogenase complex dihydrolipoamide dehydrogenase (E3) component